MCLYLVSALGITVTAHYCGGKLASVAVNFTGADLCKCGSKKMKDNCCKTTTCSFQIKDVQDKTAEVNFSFSSFNFQPAMPVTIHTGITELLAEHNFSINHPPPPEIKPPLYLLNRVFRI